MSIIKSLLLLCNSLLPSISYTSSIISSTVPLIFSSTITSTKPSSSFRPFIIFSNQVSVYQFKDNDDAGDEDKFKYNKQTMDCIKLRNYGEKRVGDVTVLCERTEEARILCPITCNTCQPEFLPLEQSKK